MNHFCDAMGWRNGYRALHGLLPALLGLFLLAGFTLPASATPQLIALDIDPCNLAGGLQATGIVTLSAPAVAPTIVQITNLNPAAIVPASVTVPQGATSVSFNVVTLPVAQKAVGSIYGTLNGIAQYMTLSVLPVNVGSFTVCDDYVYEGSGTRAPISLAAVSPYDTVVTLQSDTPAVVSVPSSVVIPAGTLTYWLPLQCNAVSANTRVILTANVNGMSATTTLTVRPLRIQTFALSATSILGGGPVSGTVTLAGPAPTTGKTVALSSSDPSVTVPQSIVVPAGQTTVQFGITTSPLAANLQTTLEASVPTMNAYAGLLVCAPGVLSVQLPAAVKAGATATGTVTLNSAPTVAAVTIRLVSDNTSAATVVATVVIPVGQTTGTFKLNARSVAANTTVNITASANGSSQSAPVIVTP